MRFGLNEFIDEICLEIKRRGESPTSTNISCVELFFRVYKHERVTFKLKNVAFKLKLEKGTVDEILSLCSQFDLR